MELRLTAVYEEVPKEDGGGYVTYVEELPGAITQRDTLEEPRQNLRDAVELLIEANRSLVRQTQGQNKIIHEPIEISVE